MCAKYSKQATINYLIKCPYCEKNIDSEIFENHLDVFHDISYLETYGFRFVNLIESESFDYYFEFTINEEKNHNTRGYSIETGLNNYIQNLPASAFRNATIVENNSTVTNQKVLFINWDNIVFLNEKIKISGFEKKIKNPIIYFPKSFFELNLIKDTFFKKNYDSKFKFVMIDGNIELSLSEGYNKIQDIFDTSNPNSEFIDLIFENNEFKILNTDNLSNSEILNLPSIQKYNNHYFKLLSTFQNPDLKLIPIAENNNGNLEHSIVFQIKSQKNQNILIWENLNPNRATYVFLERSNTISNLKHFISSNEIKNKRYSLKSDYIVRNKLDCIKVMNHVSFDHYKDFIESLINIH